MNIHKKIGWLMLIILMLIGVIKIVIPYEQEYFQVLGIDVNTYTLYDVIEIYGMPKKFIESDDETGFPNAVYDDFTIRLTDKTPNAQIVCISINNEKYKFGLLNTGVGSKKKWVKLAYMFKIKSPDSTDDVYAYVDGKIYVEYYFSDDTVYKVVFSEYG